MPTELPLRKTIIVESCPLLTHTISRRLHRQGYEPIAAFDNGEEALDYWMYEINEPVLVLLGYALRGAYTGIHTAAAFLAMDRNRVLLITGWEKNAFENLTRTSSRCRHLGKPFTEQQLLSLLLEM